MIRLSLFCVGAVALALPLIAGCENREECERARLQAYRAYQTLYTAAVQRKLAGVQPEQWALLENKADLLQSAFATQQVTWKSAEKTRAEVQTALESVHTDNEVNLEIFKGSANEAFKLQEQFAKQCR
jgi:hypothetical protein